MEKIFDPDETFCFAHLFLATPTIISGGNYLIKYLMNERPLYIQAPKCVLKQGLLKAGKKMFCDMMFTNENEKFMKWMEDLENYSQEYIFKNKSTWFENDLEKHDIENSFTSPLKLYKGGKFYTIRVNVPTRLGKCSLKVFDEDESMVDLETMKENTNVISILEIQGIKCSAKSFQIEMEVKQMMIMKPSKLFEKCVIHVANGGGGGGGISSSSQQELEKPKEKPDKVSFFSKDLEEINLTLDNVSEKEINLKNKKEVYYKMYKETKKKAKIARKMALSAYLEVKRIKNLYMLDDIPDSDEDNEEDDDEEQEESDTET